MEENQWNGEPAAEPEQPREHIDPQEPVAAQEPADSQEPAAAQEPVEPTWGQAAAWHAPDEPYRDPGAGRKESPFADSPYVMNYAGQPAQPPKPPKKKKGGKAWKAVLAAVLAVVLVAGGCGITAAALNSYWENRNSQTVSALNQRIRDLEQQVKTGSGGTISGSPISSSTGAMSPSQVYQQNVVSTVAISVQSTTNIFGQVRSTASSGSGFIYSEDGYVITNYHVVEGANTITVLTYDATKYNAALVGYDETNDIAVLKMEGASGLRPVTIGSSSALQVGEMVEAIGNPLGELTSTLTVGYVSAKDRDVTTDNSVINMIQTDAAINPGNSGGPLFNMQGEVIGITSAKYSGTTSSGASIEGIGFAIPIDDVAGMIEDIINYGYIKGAYLGVSVSNMDDNTREFASTYGIPVGVTVQSVTAGSCADTAGVHTGDIIFDLGGYEVESYTDLARALRNFEPGDTTTISVYRSGQTHVLNITLDEKPNTAVTEPQGDNPMPSEGSGYDEWYDYFFGNRGR